MSTKLLVIFLCIILILILIKYQNKNNFPATTKQYYDITENNYYPDISSIQRQHNHETHYLFWTGGYDSTYRLLELIIQNKKIQPIYLMTSDLDSNYNFQRQNKFLEIKTMKQIRNQIYFQFPGTKINLLPTCYVYQIKINPDIQQKYIYISKKKYSFKRGVTQYERMTQYSYYYPYPIEVGLEKCGTGLDKLTMEYRKGFGNQCQVDLESAPPEYYIMKNLRFPVCHLTKEDMLKKCIENGTDNILQMTWTCWFPINGKPCGKCNMCQHRII